MSLVLARAHILGQERLRELVERAVTVAWAGLPGYDERDVDPFVAQVAPVVLAAQHQSVALTDAYLARALGRQPLGLNAGQLTGPAARNGTTPDEEWRRPFITVWTALSRNRPYDGAVAAGLHRAQGMAAMDVQLSMRGTVAAITEADDSIVGYQRVTDGKACTLCQIASTQRYHRGDLLPIHTHCGCGVVPIIGEDRGQVIDPTRLASLKEAGEINRLTAQRQAARARGQQTTEPVVHEHGELGPVLTDSSHHFELL